MVNNLKVTTSVVPTALICTFLHEFHNCRGHQGSGQNVQPPKKKVLVERYEMTCEKPHQQLHHMFQKPSQCYTSPTATLRNS